MYRMVKNLNMEKNNKLIAKFMGWERDDFSLDGYIIPKNWNSHHDLCQDFDSLSPKDMMFHNSWDWLMPVVEKIQHLDNEFEVNVNFKIELTGAVELYINHKRVFGMTAFEVGTLIDAVYEAIIEFIKWYNKNKKDNDMDTRKCT